MTEATITEAAATVVTKTPRELLTDSYNALIEKRTAFLLKIDAKLAVIVAEINGIDTLASLTVGAAVLIKVGKGETAKEVQGVIEGERTEEDGTKSFKVSFGEGFDRDVKVVRASAVRLPEQV